MSRRILVTGGAGYVGSKLVPKLLELGHKVVVLDLFWFCEKSIFANVTNVENLKVIQGDIRDYSTIKNALLGCSGVIHLACISNDPSFDLDPELGKSINFDSFEPFVKLSKEEGVNRFIYASSSSVYGIKEVENVTEDLEVDPLTDYSKYKYMCEEVLEKYTSDEFCCTSLRPATVCGSSPRQRLDVVVNILTNHAVNRNEIKIFNGEQLRPNIHIDDMCEAYIKVLNSDKAIVNGKVYNVGGENLSVKEISSLVREVTKVEKVVVEKNDDIRSYHISSEKFRNDLKLMPSKGVKDAIADLVENFKKGTYKDPLNNSMYFNVKFLKERSIG
jgi:nucleoside-diphosphate-sugar epimerase